LIILISLFTSCNPSNSEQKTINDRSDDNYLEISRDIFNNLMLVKGEVVYVPVYSEIYTDLNKKTKLAATLSIRNTDMKNEIIVSMADYYDTHGNPIRNYIKSPVKLKPLQTVNYLVEYKEAKGGTGANFIVEWASEIEVTEPIIEAVMIGTSSSLGISFVCEGRVIKYVTD
jgi:hypothetical protein